MTRRFEFVGGTSAKFWEITRCWERRHGAVRSLGTDGQMQTKSFAQSRGGSAGTPRK